MAEPGQTAPPQRLERFSVARFSTVMGTAGLARVVFALTVRTLIMIGPRQICVPE